MYVDAVSDREAPPSSGRASSIARPGKVLERTPANLSAWGSDAIEGGMVLLCGDVSMPRSAELLVAERSLPHGHVAAELARRAGTAQWSAAAPASLRPLLPTMLASRAWSLDRVVSIALNSTVRP